MSRIGRLRERRLLGRAAEQALGGGQVDAGPIPRTALPHGDDAPPRADDMFGGLVVAPWMFTMRARPWYRTRPAAIAFVGAAAAVVISGALLALRTPTTATEKPTTVATTPSTRATPPASSEPPASSIPPSPPIAPPPSPPSAQLPYAQPLDPEPVTAGPGSLEDPPPAEPLDPEPAIAGPDPPKNHHRPSRWTPNRESWVDRPQIGPIAWAMIIAGMKMSSETGADMQPISIPRPA